MNELAYTKTFTEWQQELDTELTKSAEGFVRIGYLLKMARDTDILKDSGYSSIIELAKNRYGLDKTQVSRFIHINDRFSEGGNSDKLMDKYKGFGYAKLTIMLQLPDVINEELTENFSKAEIQSVKEELDKEKETTDLEILMEEPDKTSNHTDMLMKAVMKLGEDEPELYTAIFEQNRTTGCTVEQIKDDMCPNDEKIYFIRLAGIGRMVLSLKTSESTIKLINTRSGEKQEYTWQQLCDRWTALADSGPEITAHEQWSIVYGRQYPVKEEKEELIKEKKPTKVVKVKKQKEQQVEERPVKEQSKEELPKEQPRLKNEDIPKVAETLEKPINASRDMDSTPKPSTPEIPDCRATVFNEMLGVANGLVACVLKKDIEGIQEHVADIQHILDSLAADKKKDIPGQMELEEIIEGKENVKEQN